MPQIIKKLRIFNFTRTKFLWFGFFLVFLILGVFLPLQQAQAFVDVLAGLIITYAIAFIVQFALAISNFVLQFATWILSWVLSDNFITLSFTDPARNPLIQVGWTLTRDLANISFVIILIIIGLATALRLGEYQWQKALPRLIIVALLINFTPIILGLIVDASNIVMNFFLQKLTGLDVLGRQFGVQGSILMDVLKGFFNPLAVIQSIFQGLVLIGFNLLAAVILFLFAGLFIMRYVAIWLLVILSPFAFACYILPATRKYFSTWWNQFVQWCIIGIFAAFFIYLTNYLLVQVPTLSSPPASDWWAQPFVSFMNSMMPYAITLAFLIMGFYISLTTSAIGASGIITAVKKGGGAAGKMATSKGWQWTKKTAGDVKAETARIQRTYQAGRALGLSRARATGEAVRRYWRRRALPAMRPAAVGRATVRAAGGILSATRDIATAAAMAGLGIKRRGFRTCPTCGNRRVSARANACPTCGHVF